MKLETLALVFLAVHRVAWIIRALHASFLEPLRDRTIALLSSSSYYVAMASIMNSRVYGKRDLAPSTCRRLRSSNNSLLP